MADEPAKSEPDPFRSDPRENDSRPNGAPTQTVEASVPEGADPPGGDERSGKPHPARRKPRDPGIARAFRTRRAVQGRVDKIVKGGYEIRANRTRAFCPFSQMALDRIEDREAHVGKTYLFRVIEFRRGGEDVVLSRRAVLEEERGEEAKAVRATLIEGGLTRGRVSSVAEFGAFVDLGAGVTGLVHISELSASRIEKAADAVKVGDWVPVRILKLDDATGRISLSIRQGRDDPWQAARERFRVGEVHEGKVVRITDFGAFVEMTAGVEALARARDFPPEPGGWPGGVEAGQDREWLVLEVQPERRRMSVAPPPKDGSASARVAPGSTVTGRVQKVERFGVFVWLGPGQVGLLPGEWSGTPVGTDLRGPFPVGSEVEVDVVDVSEGGRRIRLARKGLAVEAAAARPPKKRAPGRRSEAPQPAAPDGAFGTALGDALREALGRSAEDDEES